MYRGFRDACLLTVHYNYFYFQLLLLRYRMCIMHSFDGACINDNDA